MAHKVRQRVISSIGLPVTKVETVRGELGSGEFDKHGNEIFEGDIVEIMKTERREVKFYSGSFQLAGYARLAEFAHGDLEIVGRTEACGG